MKYSSLEDALRNANGGKRLASIPVARLASGEQSEITLHVLGQGKPVVGIVIGTHGGETFVTELIRVFLENLKLERLAGTLIVAPMVNTLAFAFNARHTPNDVMNVNRVFPGARNGWYSDMLASAIVEDLLPHVDWIIDYHCPTDKCRACRFTYTKSPSTEYGRLVHEAAVASGAPVLYEASRVAGSLGVYCEDQGIPAVVVEIGGSPGLDDEMLPAGLLELDNLLVHIGALRGPAGPPTRQLLVKSGTHLRPRAGGLLSALVKFDQLGIPFDGRVPLARIYDPSSFEMVEEVVAPFDSNVLMSARVTSKVDPGDYAYSIGDATTAIWLE